MRGRIFDAFRRARRSKPDGAEGAWMPLADAAQALRRIEQGSDLDRMSRGLSDSDESLLAFWARRVWQIGVPVYGSRIMATKLEIIPEETMLAGRIYDQAMRLDIGRGAPIEDFCALQVKRAEFEARLARAGGSRRRS